MRFILYLTDNYEEGKESARIYHELKKQSWLRVIKRAKECGEIRPDTNENLLAEAMYTLYIGQSYRGAMRGGLSTSALQELWENSYQSYKAK